MIDVDTSLFQFNRLMVPKISFSTSLSYMVICDQPCVPPMTPLFQEWPGDVSQSRWSTQ